MTTDRNRNSTHLPAHVTRPRLGWWHSFWRTALLVGHGHQDLAVLSPSMPGPIRDLTVLIETRRSEFAAIARTRGADYKGGYWMMYLVAPLAVLCSALAAVAIGSGRVLAGIEFVMIVAILLLFMAMRHGGWQERWIRARRTSEHLRYLPLVAPFVRNRTVNWYEDVAAHHGMRIIVDEEVTRMCLWLAQQDAARSLRLDDRAFCAEYLTYVDALLRQQIAYHANNSDLEHALSWRISLTSSIFFGVTILATALLFLESLTASLGIDHYLSPRMLRLCATVLPAIGAGLRGVLAQGESHRVAALSEGMAIRLAQLRDQIAKLPPTAAESGELESLVWNAVQELLSEADTWMRLQESVPLSVAG